MIKQTKIIEAGIQIKNKNVLLYYTWESKSTVL
jgi:hypothetical protein